MPDAPLHYMTITELAALIEARQVSPVEITEYMLRRIENIDGKYKSYATVMADQAEAAAKAAEAEITAGRHRGPLHGVPFAVKDLCFTTGVRTMGGSKVYIDHIPPFDATVVAKLNAAGAVPLGKLNLTEGAMGGYNPALDLPLNPWNTDRWCGSSSSGSGVATAGGAVLRLARQRYGRLHTIPRRRLRHSGTQANLGARQPLRCARPRRIARPCGPAHPKFRRRRHRASGYRRARPQRPHIPARARAEHARRH